MELYQQLITRFDELLPKKPAFNKAYSPADHAKPSEKNAFLFQSDVAFELGGSSKADACGTLFTSQCIADEILLYGKDLTEITGDSVFGHITVISMIPDDKNLYYEDFTRLSFDVSKIYAQGYHIRLSPSLCREQVRVAKSALTGDPPLSFYRIGCSLIGELKKDPRVRAVKTVFITTPEIDFRKLSSLCFEAKKVTDAVQSALRLDELDCASCRMKPICDEVEGLRELHLKQTAGK